MTREEAKILLPVIQAYSEGKPIEIVDSLGKWHELYAAAFDDDPKKYRIKPSPKYRPFNNAEECWQQIR